jgi:translation elongation factor EF-1beta
LHTGYSITFEKDLELGLDGLGFTQLRIGFGIKALRIRVEGL